jgi:hypothetical protein
VYAFGLAKFGSSNQMELLSASSFPSISSALNKWFGLGVIAYRTTTLPIIATCSNNYSPALTIPAASAAPPCAIPPWSAPSVGIVHVGGSVFGPIRYYAIVITSGGRDLNELLVSSGLARIFGTRTPLPDGRDSRDISRICTLWKTRQGREARRVGYGAAVKY